MSFIVAIDEPSCSGKSTIARILALELGFSHIQSGAIYRCIGLQMLNENIGITNEKKIARLLTNINISFKNINGKQRTFLNSEDVTDTIRTTNVTDFTSKVASIIFVRDSVDMILRRLAQNNNIIMDGRDIGTEVFPNADIKFFLNASPIVRAKRKQKELLVTGSNVSLNNVLKSMYTWDYDAINRKKGALRRAPDSIYIDTSALEIDKLKEIMLKAIEQKIIEKDNLRSEEIEI